MGKLWDNQDYFTYTMPVSNRVKGSRAEPTRLYKRIGRARGEMDRILTPTYFKRKWKKFV